MPVTITDAVARDIRFPTSEDLSGSDAMNPDPDYSAAYVVLKTDTDLEGHGLTFTIGRGTEICVAAINTLVPLVVGQTLESLAKDMGAFWRHVTGDSQLRWIGPEKGVITSPPPPSSTPSGTSTRRPRTSPSGSSSSM